MKAEVARLSVRVTELEVKRDALRELLREWIETGYGQDLDGLSERTRAELEDENDRLLRDAPNPVIAGIAELERERDEARAEMARMRAHLDDTTRKAGVLAARNTELEAEVARRRELLREIDEDLCVGQGCRICAALERAAGKVPR
jgi:hypothetical protein